VEVSAIAFSCFLPYAHQLLSYLSWPVFGDLRFGQIPSHSVKTLHKTVYETVEQLWR
jgi:hypothetical protein